MLYALMSLCLPGAVWMAAASHARAMRDLFGDSDGAPARPQSSGPLRLHFAADRG